jgi:hypothetical protein
MDASVVVKSVVNWKGGARPLLPRVIFLVAGWHHAASGGVSSCTPPARCQAMPARQSRASSKCRATIWKPIGEPLASSPAGSVRVGWPVVS